VEIKSKKNIFIVISFVILFCGFFYVFLSSKLFDSDFWWHIATGRYIVETGTIPDKDPFSYTTNLEENKNLLPERERFLFKQYWLSQIIFYLIYDSLGPKGMILTRAIILITVLLLILWRLKRSDVSFYVSFIYVFLVYLEALRYAGERPVLFTVLFTPLTFIILEEFKDSVLKQSDIKSEKILFLLLPLMFLWSNLHGGFIIGNIIIGCYMFSEGFKIILKKAGYTKHEIVIFYTATASALLISYINPTGWEAFSIALSSKYEHFYIGIQEYESPFFMYINKLSRINYGYVTLTFLFPLILILRNKKMDLTHIILLSGLFIMAAKAGRYTIYYTSIAAMVLGSETHLLFKNLFRRIPDRIFKKLTSVFIIVILLSAILFFIGVFKFKWLKFDVAKGSHVPVAAVDFIEKNKIPGNIFNADPYGGYITWRLYPWKKNFIDTRWLNYTMQTEYGWMMNAVESISNKGLPIGKKPLWKRLLDHYNINFVLLDTLDVHGTVPKLLLTLAEDEEWAPIYCEPIAIIFIKNVPENRDIIKKFKRPKEDVYNTVISLASQIAIYDRQNPKYLITLGSTFYEMGRLNDALTAYQYALKRFPEEADVKKMISKIESELKMKGKEDEKVSD
jgi:hypothetical protein